MKLVHNEDFFYLGTKFNTMNMHFKDSILPSTELTESRKALCVFGVVHIVVYVMFLHAMTI